MAPRSNNDLRIDDTPSDLSDKSVMDTLQMIKSMRRRNYKVAISAFESQLGCSVNPFAYYNSKICLNTLVLVDIKINFWKKVY